MRLRALTGLVPTYREETRTIQHFTFEPGKLVKLDEPDEAKLKEIYDTQKRQFVTPEYRNVVVLALSAEEVRKTLEIPDADIRAAYDGDNTGREVPERRRVQQIPFKDKAAADAAAKAIAASAMPDSPPILPIIWFLN